MGLLDNFERGLERAVNGAFAKTFRSGVQPLEITNALRRELDTKAAVVSRDRILVPNELLVRLAPADYEKMSAIGSALIDELTQLTQRHATAQGYQFAGPIGIRLREDESLSIGIMNVESRNVRGEVQWKPVVDVDGKRVTLTGSRTILGRGSDADITIQDTGASRQHAEILWDGTRGQVRDLGSTNGTKLNGNPLSKAPLLPDSVIEIGRTRIVFRVLPQSASVDPFDGFGDSGGRR
ncbi:FhaA domain-containing protein [Frigoribacterium sp. 2-23]|uniref:FhaA domain-containing protein n=1 Tax=Frigoribacterium sp. 2-23 TaxID=3415006 RepID=UPI003C6F8871